MSLFPSGFTLRAPWPDELPRLNGLFHLSRLDRPAHLRLLSRDGPERIVGGLLLSEPVEQGAPGALLLRLRPAYRFTAVHEGLVRAARELAREAGCESFALTLADDEAEDEFYRRQGAVLQKTDLFYEGALSRIDERLAPLRRRLSASGGGKDRYRTRSLSPGDHAVAAAMAEAHGLLAEARARHNLSHDYDPGLSVVCVSGEIVVGALLIKVLGRGQVYAEARMVHPDHRAASALINLLLLDATLKRSLAAGHTTFSLSARVGKDRETINLARRLDCRLTRSQRLLAWSAR